MSDLLPAKALHHGAGKHHEADWPPQRLQSFLIYTFANEIIHASIITCVKSSVLCLYLRLFGVNKKFAKIVKFFLALVAGCGVVALFTCIFQCRPVSGAWDLSVPRGRCFNLRNWLIATNILNILIDLSILLLPVPLVWRLQLSTARKIGLIGVFTLYILQVI
ncbi:MAG: hypothetical protein L6R39_003046 [Caloplaca ligustica]|nr:MAG: hypothetical protein L6R39_003046 [Caloplaca ligustica]